MLPSFTYLTKAPFTNEMCNNARLKQSEIDNEFPFPVNRQTQQSFMCPSVSTTRHSMLWNTEHWHTHETILGEIMGHQWGNSLLWHDNVVFSKTGILLLPFTLEPLPSLLLGSQVVGWPLVYTGFHSHLMPPKKLLSIPGVMTYLSMHESEGGISTEVSGFRELSEWKL